MQIAHFLEGPLAHWGEYFWSIVDHGGSLQLSSEHQALLNATHPSIVAAVCNAHPIASDSSTTIQEKLPEMACIVDAVAVRCSSKATDDGPVLVLTDESELPADDFARIAAALPLAHGARSIRLEASPVGGPTSFRELVVAAKPLLQQAVRGTPVAEIEIEGMDAQSFLERTGDDEYLAALVSGAAAGLRTLDLFFVNWSRNPMHEVKCPHAMLTLAATFPTLTSLTALHIAGAYFTDALTAPFSSKLSSLKALCRLKLIHSFVPATACLQGVSALSALTSLHVYDNQARSRSDDVLLLALSPLEQLADLRLEHLTFESARVPQRPLIIGPSLGNKTRLTSLSFASSSMSEAEYASLAACLPYFGNLQSFSLRQGILGAAGVAAFARAFSQMSSLSRLDFGHFRVRACSFEPVASQLPAFGSLRSLSLGVARLGDAGTAALARSLSSLTELTQFELTQSSITPDGAAMLAPALAMLAALVKVEVRNNPLTASGALHAVRAFSRLARLQDLAMPQCSIGSAGMNALAAQLSRLTRLSELVLLGNPLHDAGLHALAPALTALTQLRLLALQNTQGSDGIHDHIRELLAANTQLQINL